MLKKLSIILLILSFVSYNNVLSFDGKTHYQITRSAIINTKLLDHFPIEHRKKLKGDLLKSCNFPDNDTSSYITGFYSHFFNPDKGFDGLEEKDFTLINLRGNAFTSMYADYLEAKELWRKGNQFESIDKLGRSIHYMQDMCCIAHEMNWKDNIKFFLSGQHVKYENIINDYISMNFYKFLDTYKDFDFRKVQNVGSVAVSMSSLLKSKFIDKYRSSNIDNLDIEKIGIAHKATCKLIYIFFKEVGIKL